jgi:DNA-binding CsgD family transcriptional regulator
MNDFEIGEELCISHHTAHSHRKEIYKKFAAHSDLEAVLVGIERGYLKFT